MIVQRFVKWCETASVAQRAAGVAVLATAWVEGRVPGAERGAAEAALTLVLDDPSPKVRKALAEILAASAEAPRPIVLALLEDVEEIACLVAGCSPVLRDGDLVDLAAASPRVQTAVAARARLGRKASAALAEVGCRAACLRLLGNGEAAVTAVSYRRMAERLGDDAALRSALLARPDLPADIRQRLILELGRALSHLPMVRNCVGARRADRIALDACERATAVLAETVPAEEAPALVEHLRASGQLSTAFLLRTVCSGNIDLFAAALVSLGAMSGQRVRAIVVEGREPAFRSMIEACGLPRAAAPLLRTAVQIWRKAAAGRLAAPAEDMPQLVMERVVASFRERRDEAGFEEVLSLLHRLAAETARDTARKRARRMAA